MPPTQRILEISQELEGHNTAPIYLRGVYPHSRDAGEFSPFLLRRSHSAFARRRRGAFMILPDGVNSAVC